MEKLRLYIAILFLAIGLLGAYMTYSIRTTYPRSEGSFNDGRTAGLGVLSGFAFLSCALLLKKE